MFQDEPIMAIWVSDGTWATGSFLSDTPTTSISITFQNKGGVNETILGHTEAKVDISFSVFLFQVITLFREFGRNAIF